MSASATEAERLKTMTALETKEEARTEARMVNMVRNALLVAGTEMGETGDHWPVVNATIHSVMQDFEDLQIERNVDAELKIHMATWLNELDATIAKSPASYRPAMEQGLRELRELYAAYFDAPAEDLIYVEEEKIPDHVKRVKQIVSVLEE